MDQQNTHTSVCELQLQTNPYPESFITKTTRFSPLFDDSIQCYFEATYTKMNDISSPFNQNASFDLVFRMINKQNSLATGSSSQMIMDVTVYYFDGSLFNKYETKTGIKVKQVDYVAFENVLYASHFMGALILDHCKMKNGLNIVCKITLQTSTDFVNNIMSAYKSGVCHDFVFNVRDKSFPAHKFILVAHSPIFLKMMTQEYQKSKTNNIIITDTTPEIFEMFLKYLYIGEISDKSWSSVKGVYHLADKYDVVVLKNSCIRLIKSLMSIDLVCDILIFVYTYNIPYLKLAAKQFVKKNLKEIISSEDWERLVATHPQIGFEVLVDLAPK